MSVSSFCLQLNADTIDLYSLFGGNIEMNIICWSLFQLNSIRMLKIHFWLSASNINNIYSKSNYWTIGQTFVTGYYAVERRLVD